MEQNDAETWAVWQALEIVWGKTYTDSGYIVPLDLCSLAVIYTDSHAALHQIGRCDLNDGIARRIGDQASELQELGVDVQLHWLPSHEKIPGNELADRTAKQAASYRPCSALTPSDARPTKTNPPHNCTQTPNEPTNLNWLHQ